MTNGTLFRQQFINSYIEEKGFDILTLKQIIDNSFGESNEIDFKEKLISEEKIAKIILAMANSGGGTVLFGITDNGVAIGIENDIKDPTDYEKKLDSFLPHNLQYYTQEITFNDDPIYKELSGKKFLILQIPKQYRFVPFLAKKESGILKSNEIYVRKNTSTSVVTNEELEHLLKMRIHAQYKDLSNLSLTEHINQLKTLYNNIAFLVEENEPEIVQFHSETGSYFAPLPIDLIMDENPHYPTESFDEFISKAIDEKKRKIEMILDINNL